MEKMPQKKVQKFVSNDSNHKALENYLVAKTPDSGMSSMKGEKLDDDFNLETDAVGKMETIIVIMMGMCNNQLAHLEQKIKGMITKKKKNQMKKNKQQEKRVMKKNKRRNN